MTFAVTTQDIEKPSLYPRPDIFCWKASFNESGEPQWSQTTRREAMRDLWKTQRFLIGFPTSKSYRESMTHYISTLCQEYIRKCVTETRQIHQLRLDVEMRGYWLVLQTFHHLRSLGPASRAFMIWLFAVYECSKPERSCWGVDIVFGEHFVSKHTTYFKWPLVSYVQSEPLEGAGQF